MTFRTYRLRRSGRLHRGPKAASNRLVVPTPSPPDEGQTRLELVLLVVLTGVVLLSVCSKL